MKKLLFILFALPMLWGCKDKESEIQQPLTFWEQLIVDATEVVNQVIAEYGDYKAEEVAELLCGKEWSENTGVFYDDSWANVTDAPLLENRPYWPGYSARGPILFSQEGEVLEVLHWEEPGVDKESQYTGAWRFNAESRTIELVWSLNNGETWTESYLLQALGEDCFVWDSTSEGRNSRYIYKAK